MTAAGVTENLAIRTLEIFADVYAKLAVGGNASPHHVKQVGLWSRRARELSAAMPDAKPKDHFRVEHGTPRRGFARKVLALYRVGELTGAKLAGLVDSDYRLAVITLEEDARLNKVARSRMCGSPQERWAAAGIEF